MCPNFNSIGEKLTTVCVYTHLIFTQKLFSEARFPKLIIFLKPIVLKIWRNKNLNNFFRDNAGEILFILQKQNSLYFFKCTSRFKVFPKYKQINIGKPSHQNFKLNILDDPASRYDWHSNCPFFSRCYRIIASIAVLSYTTLWKHYTISFEYYLKNMELPVFQPYRKSYNTQFPLKEQAL